MTTLWVSLSIASVLTALFAFRFRYWDRPKLLTAYFAFFLGVELVAQHYFLPPGAIGAEVAWICFPLAAAFVGMTFVARKLEASQDARG